MDQKPVSLRGLLKSADGEQTSRALESAAKAYQTQCADRAKRFELEYRTGALKDWAALAACAPPPMITAQPLSFTTLKAFLTVWVSTAAARFKAEEAERRKEVATVSTKFVAAESRAAVRQFGRFKLRPRQIKAIDACVERLRSGDTQAVIVPLEGGEGKSVIGWYLIDHWQKNEFFGHPIAKVPINQAFFDTKATVVINMNRRGRACGVANIDRSIAVVSHTSWGAKEYKHFFREEVVTSYGQPVTRLNYILIPPAIIVIDECQDYKKPSSQKSKYLEALVRKGVECGSVFIFMSATPWVTINDTWLFCIATGREWAGERITRETFPSMARAIAARAGVPPSANSEAAMKEFRKEFNDCYVIPPRDPRTVKAYNDVILVDFKSPEQRAYYDATMARYDEERRRQGKDGDINKMTVFLKKRHAEERIKCPVFADLMVASHANGFAPVCGVTTQDAVKELTRLLVFEHGIPRNKISVIWGGDQIINRASITKKVGPDIMANIGSYLMRFYQEPDKMTADEKTAVRKYLRWAKEQARFDESEDQQTVRHSELITLRLDKQSLEQRQNEIDRFQNGDTEYCIFTLSAGGVGVDLDHQVDGVRPREGFFTICYWAEEFMQALFRLMRVATLSDVRQHIVFFKDTIVANHVAPRLDKKIKSVRAATQGADEFVEDMINLLVDAPAAAPSITQADLSTGDNTEDTPDNFDPDAVIEDLVGDDELP